LTSRCERESLLQPKGGNRILSRTIAILRGGEVAHRYKSANLRKRAEGNVT
jgi:hypothetical protein